MTTIITKNGSGAPTAGQLSEGELAVDLTNKELYTKSGSTVIKIGSQGGSTGTFTDLTATSSFTSPGIDDNANATAITIDASENVAIGTGTVLYPSADRTALTVNGTSSANLVFGHGGVPKHYLLSDAAGLTIGSDGNARLTIDATGNVGYSGKLFSSNAPATLGGLQLYRNHANGECFLFDTTAAPYSGPLIFGTSNAERMRLDASGNLLVSRTDVAAVSVPSASLNADGSVYSSVATANSYHLYNTGAAAYKFYVSASGIIHAGSSTITVLSDERLKENIRDLDDGLDKIMALQPRKFDWKEGKGQDHADARGFIAQELEVVFPDMVNDDGLNLDEDGESYKTISPNLIPTLVKAMQEQQAMIETLQAEVAALKGA